MPTQKLELTWVGKDQQVKIEPRILLEDPEKGYGDRDMGNLLIHGDNLLALKALETDYSGLVKCIYIDPPFNTEQAFENYDDNLEISIWLNLMYERLRIIKRLLRDEGTLFIHIDDGNLANLIAMTDEIFGRRNRLYVITFKQGSATGHKAINPGCVNTTNFIVMYAKDKSKWYPNRIYTGRERDVRYGQYIENITDSYKNWRIMTLTSAFAKQHGLEIREARKMINDNPSLIDEFVIKNACSVIRTARPDYDSVGAEVKSSIDESRTKRDEILHLERTGNPDMYFLNGERLLFYKDKLKLIDNEYVSGEPLTTLWDDILSNNLHNEGGVSFPKGKKPEFLIKRVLDLVTVEGDLVLDSFLGSGTTAAVAHKMKRRWIGIEFGEHCFTHCIPRLKNVVNGEQSGISKAMDWKGGSGFRFCELAPSLLRKDKYGQWVIDERYNADMLAAAMAKHEGFRYSPDPEVYWKQGYSSEKSFIFTTTAHITAEYVDALQQELKSGETLLICASTYEPAAMRFPHIVVKKIPQILFGRCEFGAQGYGLNIVTLPDVEEEEE